jgi:hypothetical protein
MNKKLLFMSDEGEDIGIAYAAAKEGHDVVCWMKPIEKQPNETPEQKKERMKGEQYRRDLGKGLITRVESYAPYVKKDRAIIFTMTGMGDLADKLRKSGMPVWGGAAICDEMEQNREKSALLFEEAGIEMPYTEVFSSYKEGIKYLEGKEGRFYFKPYGKTDCASTFGAKSSDLLIRMMKWWESKSKDKSIEFEIQDWDEGIAVDLEGWYDATKQDFISGSLNTSFEEKRNLSGGYGQHTGSESNLVFAYSKIPKLYDETLAKMLPLFIKNKLPSCPIDVNFLIDGKSIKALEFCMRIGYNPIFAFMSLWTEPIGDTLFALAHDDIDEFPVEKDVYAGALTVSVPPYPNEKFASRLEGMPVEIPLDDDDVWIMEVQEGKNGLEMVVGSGMVCDVSAKGKDIDKIKEKVFNKLDEMKIPDVQARDDAFEKEKDKISTVKEWIT